MKNLLTHYRKSINPPYGGKDYPAIAATLLFLLVSLVVIISLPNKLNQNAYPKSGSAQTVTNRITWQGNNWYIHGANVPWYNWGCDFGCNSTNGKSGGVSNNLSNLTVAFQQAKNSGVHVLRWWVFPGDPWQITRDSAGPTGIDPAVYPDFDAALNLANQYDMYFNFMLFSAPTAMPSAWETDTTQRGKLVQALSTLFAHYAGNPRILSWEIYNEPENDIWNNRIAQQPVVDTGTAIATAVHSSSPGTLVTVGSLFADGMKMWLNAGLDYYSPHWYDYMSGGDYCMICHNYSYYSAWGVTKPIVVGEFYSGTSATTPTSSNRYDYWYNNGYAGAWAWSLFPSHTSDGLQIDFTAATNFASQHADIGPIAGFSSTPTPTQAVSLTPTPAISQAPSSTPTPSPSLTPVPTVGSNDATAPTVTITSPLAGSTVAVRKNVTIQATASDNVGVSRVEFYINGTLTCTDISSPYSCSWKVPGSKNRTYKLSAKASDAAGNNSTSSISVTAR